MAGITTMALLGLSALGTAGSMIQGKKAAKQQKTLLTQQQKAAESEAAQRDMEFNKLNQKKPVLLDSLIAQNMKASKGAQGGTMLTGPKGLGDPLTLGRNTLLGG
jgi:hypothetical protein